MIRDRHRLRQQLQRIRQVQRQDKPFDRNLRRLQEQLQRSIEQCDHRRQQLPFPRFDPPELADLPILARREEIAQAIREHQVVVICGDTGSGKTTQLPKICLELGIGAAGLIGHTQPRRIAARSVAGRIAEELQVPLGRQVGYQVRFTDKTAEDTAVKLMTDGILLAETQHDRFLNQYEAIIIDEAHERSLNIDLLLGILKRLTQRRDDLKIIITSATIDPDSFSQFFDDAPVIEVSGRTYPIDVLYRPLQEADDTADAGSDAEPDPDLLQRAIRNAVDELAQRDSDGRGDMLVFLPTERDILETSKRLRRHLPASAKSFGSGETEVLPLYGRLSPGEQQKIFQKHQHRRIVLATNVAETSLTVPGIRYVIDTGLARLSRYSARANVQRLPIERISQASANQRKGRCGRVEPGVCIRLYSEDDFEGRDAFTQPEIQRSNLAGVLLQMTSMGLGDLSKFPFIDPPRGAMVTDAYRTLHELHALDDEGRTTDVGKKLARLPVDPRIGRMLMEADREHCLAEVLVVASLLEVQDPRVRPVEKQQAADEAHKQFVDERSDFMTALNLWNFAHDLKRKLSHRKMDLACRQNFLSPLRLREWIDIHRQLAQLLKEQGMKLGRLRDKPDADAVHRSVLAGLLTHVAMRDEGHEYKGTGGKKLFLWPGSVLFDRKPQWIVSAEQVETSQRFARMIAPVQPGWVERLGEHLLSRHVFEPHWDRKAARVMAYEKVTLQGLPLVAKRRCPFGKAEPAKARELFIHHALVEQEYDTHTAFFKHNRQVVDEVRRLEAKARQRDLLADEQMQFAFYDTRIPAHVADGPTFEKWRKQAEKHDAKLLFMSQQDLLVQDTAHITRQAYPDHLVVGDARLKLEYHLEPGDQRDGVTVICPLAQLNQLDDARLDWLVPGLLTEKITMMIRSLSKDKRRYFVPVPDAAVKASEQLRFAQGRLADQLADVLGRTAGVDIAPGDFDVDELPPHLRMNVRVVDDRNKALEEDRDLAKLRHTLRPQLAQVIQQSGQGEDDPWRRNGLKRWDFGELPEKIEVKRQGLTVLGYPAVVDQQNAVGLRLFENDQQAASEHRRGLVRLFEVQCRDELRYRVRSSGQVERLKLWYATLGDPSELVTQTATLIADRAFVGDAQPPRTEVDYEASLNAGWSRLSDTTERVLTEVGRLLQAYHQAARRLEQLPNTDAFAVGKRDMQSQLAALVGQGFLATTPYRWLRQYPRYLGAIDKRIDKLENGGIAKDQQRFTIFSSCLRRFAQAYKRQQSQGKRDPKLLELRWMLEEFRVSLFAQELGTSMPVSEKRVDKVLSEIH